ncbi:hypothetical protein [Phenylobacterium aquaticum]|jgi:hypothetical protein|uniref:hypothetical protein n=1 Tax=Phenylobacterium aquaticum TaxID=1763816 RepID=UPI001F5C6497|nr:hypothetical protein [Phenylobacterium aquaticum]MCI3134745.1 hypothetical protein [Phenylobacterium aquaticum]
MSAPVFFTTISLILGTVILVFGMRAYASIQQAKARSGAEEAYRQIAEKAIAAQSETAAALAGLKTALADVPARLAAVEKILKQVE